MFIESRVRSMLKALSWRVTATLTTMGLVYAYTGQVATALQIGALEMVAKLAIFYFHERGWEQIKMGRREIRPSVIWVSGLSGSGKGELADAVAQKLQDRGLKVERVDGHRIRDVIPDIGFSKNDRELHIKRVGYFARKLEDNGVFVVASFVSPKKKARDFVREITLNFFEVHVNTPVIECKKSPDHKEFYRQAEAGEIQDVAGVHFDYEETPQPEFQVDLSKASPEKSADQVLELIERRF